jgi:hypothetical protein
VSRREPALEGEPQRLSGHLLIGRIVPPVARAVRGRRRRHGLDPHDVFAAIAVQARVRFGLPDGRRCVPATAEAVHARGHSRPPAQMPTATMAPALALVAELVDALG